MNIINLTFKVILSIFLLLISFIIFFALINELVPKNPRFYSGEHVKVHYGFYTGNEGYVESAYLNKRLLFDKWNYTVVFYGDTGIKGPFNIEEKDLLKKDE